MQRSIFSKSSGTGCAGNAAASSASPGCGACRSPNDAVRARGSWSSARPSSLGALSPRWSPPTPSDGPVTRPLWAGHALLLLLAGLLPSGALAQSPAPSVPADGCRVVVDYRAAVVGEFPNGWQPRDDAARGTYRVVAEGELRFVRATAEGTGSQMGREFAWDITKEPILSWRWRPRVFPSAADERDSNRNDSALAVYAV